MIDKSILISIDYSIFEKMEKFVKNLQLLVLILILISTIVAIGLEVKTMIENGSLWIDTKNSKSYLRENDNWEEKDFIKELIEEKIATLQY